MLFNNKIKFKNWAGFFRPFFIATVLLLVISCAPEEKSELRYDYFKGKTNIKYAKGFKVAYFPSYKIVDVFDEAENEKPFQRYLLVEHGTNIPDHNKNDIIVRIPLTSLSCLSTTHVPFLNALKQIEKISGIGNPELVLDSVLLNQIDKEWTLGITSSGQADFEKILESNTSVLMASPFEKSSIEGLSEFDIPVVYVAEYLERTALGRAEWIKFFALFFNREKEANNIFSNIEKRYIDAKTKIDSVSISGGKTVFFGSYYQDVWFSPAGGTLIADLIGDAGGNYIFNTDKSNKNLTIDTEVIMTKIPEIGFWGQIITTKEKPTIGNFMANDSRLLDISNKAKTSFFFANSKQSDYFGQANLEPDVLLKDLANIFHPGLFMNHQFTYFQPLK